MKVHIGYYVNTNRTYEKKNIGEGIHHKRESLKSNQVINVCDVKKSCKKF